MKKRIHVAVGVIRGPAGKVLISLRPANSHQGGFWEFPGGKLEPGETVEQALRRELEEELGIVTGRSRPLCRIEHDYGDKTVLLDVREVLQFAGQPYGREGQPLRWLRMDELLPEEFPAANRAIIRRLHLSDYIGISAAISDEADEALFLESFTRSVRRHHGLVQLRAPTLNSRNFLSLAKQCLQICREYQRPLVLNSSPESALKLGAAGLHASSRLLMSLSTRPVGDAMLYGASCHSLEQLRHAERTGADYVFLSPVADTRSHPGQPVLGWENFSSLARQVNIPVYALGGMKEQDLPTAQRFGGHGIAAISAFWCETA